MITNIDHSLSAEPNETILLEVCANRLSRGRRTFEARALDGEGNADPTPTLWRWEVGRK